MVALATSPLPEAARGGAAKGRLPDVMNGWTWQDTDTKARRSNVTSTGRQQQGSSKAYRPPVPALDGQVSDCPPREGSGGDLVLEQLKRTPNTTRRTQSGCSKSL